MATLDASLDVDQLVDEPHYSLLPWLVIFSASLFFFFEFIQLNMFNAIDPALLQEFHISATELGQLSANYFYANVLFLFPAGMLLDRYSTRKLILAAMTLCVASTFLFSMAHTIAVAKACRFVTGIGSAFCFLSCVRLASRWFPPRRMALVIGLVVTLAMIGGMVAQTPMALLTDHYGWRRALFIDACAGTVMLFIIFMVVRDFPYGQNRVLEQQDPHVSGLGFWGTLFKTMGNPQNWLAGLYTSLLNLPIFLLGAMWGSLYLMQVHGLNHTRSTYITSMLFVGTIIGSPLLGWISDRIGQRKKPMIVCALFSLATICLIMFIPHLNLFALMALFLALGFFTSGQILSYPLIAESNPLALTGTSEGLASTLIMAGGMVQPLFGMLMGLYWNHTVGTMGPVFSPSNFLLAMSIMPIGFLIGLVAAFLLRETHCQRTA